VAGPTASSTPSASRPEGEYSGTFSGDFSADAEIGLLVEHDSADDVDHPDPGDHPDHGYYHEGDYRESGYDEAAGYRDGDDVPVDGEYAEGEYADEDYADDLAGSTMLDSMLASSGDEPPRRRRRMWGGWALLLVFVLLAAGGGVWLHDVVTRPPAPAKPTAPMFTIEILGVTPGSAVPSASAPVPADVPGPHDPQVAWVNRISAATYVPQRALSAYLNAQTVMAQRDPGCHLSWTTVAGVGWVESQHGQYGGDSIGPDDRETQPIIGPALDGTNGMRKVPDTDHGALDGDPQWDHAVGPMQFLPATWLEYGLRASNDGQAPDPQNIADAALTAGRYLCVSGGDLSVPQNWWTALYAYNNSAAYGQQVFSGADAYARATHH